MMEKLMSDKYYNLDQKEGYAGAGALKQQFPKTAEAWLSTQPAYSLHKDVRKKFPTRSYKVGNVDELWQADLMEMIPYARVNKGYKYILTVIDVFSRKAYALPLKTKSAGDVSKCLNNLIIKTNRPIHLQTDKGREFYNSQVKEILKRYNINHYSVYSKQKCALVERFNRTLRTKLSRYFTHKGHKIWYNVLPTIVNTYNNTPHSALLNGTLSPNQVNKDNSFEIWQSREINIKNNKKADLGIGDYCRISKESGGPFNNKNFDQKWSEEVFRIVGIDKRDSPIMYIIQDMRGNNIEGKFYKQEMQKIDKPPVEYRIEKIIRSKGSGKHKQYLVKWYGFKEQSWIPASNIIK